MIRTPLLVITAAAFVISGCADRDAEQYARAERELLEVELRRVQEEHAAIVAAVPRSTVRAVQQMTDAQLLAVLASTGRLERDPWAKLWHEPPLTGPRPGVDTTRYVAFARGLAARTVVRYDPARPDLPPAHFEDWPADSQAAFLAREWRCIVFNECGRAADPCVCENQAWTVRKEIP